MKFNDSEEPAVSVKHKGAR